MVATLRTSQPSLSIKTEPPFERRFRIDDTARRLRYHKCMPNDLYERDVLAWSQHQADLLRRLGRGERVNDVDWANVAEEIEDVGRSELHSVESFLNLIILHLLKLHLWPNSDTCGHWRSEIVAFQQNAKRRFSPSMKQKIDIGTLFVDAVDQLRAGDPGLQLVAENPFTLDQLLQEETTTLLNLLPPAA
jgi:hypothetical protein